MAEYITRDSVETVTLNSPIPFGDSIPCKKGYVIHNNNTGIFVLRGITSNCFARYQAVFNGNVAIPEGGTVSPISVAISVNGETRNTSIATITPAAVQEYGNVTSTAIITVPKGCCFSVAVRAVTPETDETVTPAPVIELRNANFVINRIA